MISLLFCTAGSCKQFLVSINEVIVSNIKGFLLPTLNTELKVSLPLKSEPFLFSYVN
jgi:hypothetical protein